MILFATLAYVSLDIKGWAISVEPAAFTDSKWEAAKIELTKQLGNISKVVPPSRVTQLKKIHVGECRPRAPNGNQAAARIDAVGPFSAWAG